MIWMPRQYLVLAEAFAASGDFPSLRPRSVRAAMLEKRMLELAILPVALFCMRLAITPHGRRVYVANSGWNIRQEGRPE